MSIEVMLQELERLDVKLWVEAGKLKYKAPPGALSDEMRSRLQQHRDSLLHYLERAPLTAAQYALWLQQQWDPGTSAYHIAFAVELSTPLEPARLTEALGKLLTRHAALRANLGRETAALSTVIAAQRAPDLRLRAVSQADESDVGFLRAALEEPFDLTQDVLLRGYSFQAPERQWFMLVVHHFVADGASFWTLWSELSTLLSGLELAPTTSGSYADYAREEAQMLSGPLRATATSYYRERLAGCVTMLDLPNDLPYPKTYRVRGATIEQPLGERAERVRAVAKQLRATPYALVMTVFGAWIHRLTGQERFVVGCPLLGRIDPRYQNTVGHFVNVLPVRMDFSGGVAFDEVVAETREELLGAMAHQVIPIGAVASELDIEHHPSRSALIQVTFGAQKPPPGTLADATGAWGTFGGVPARPLRVPQQEGYFELMVDLIESDQSLALTFKYNTSLFTEGAVRRYIECFESLLDAALADPLSAVSALNWVPKSQVDQVTKTFNAARCPVDAESVVDKILRSCREQPAALAVSSEERELSYGELDSLSAGLAVRLREAGLNEGDVVALILPPGADMLITTLGAWRAGLTYLPIDPAYPAERIAYMLTDSGARALVASAAFLAEASGLAATVGCRVSTEEITSAVAPTHRVSGAATAYLVYTSGSAGRPKGVAVAHAALSNLCAWHNAAFEVTAADRAAKYAGWGFDASVWEIFPYLCAGASLHVVPEDSRLDVERLNAFFERSRVSIAFLPTPVCERFSNVANTSLRLLLTGGEALRSERHLGRYRLINNYGPTEACVVSTSGPARRHESGALPIGKPVANTQAYVVAADGSLCPIGIAGELCVAGANLAVGYPRQPEETQQRFTDRLVPGVRVYKTGDRVRWLDSGELQFLGRLDRQVKIRGVRIELGEVERVLASVAEVDAVVATLWGEDEPELIAYYVSDAGVEPATLQARARAQLPSAAVPVHFVRLAELPLTPNGKLDTRALPPPRQAEREGDEASFSELEAQLAALWKQHLRVDRLKRSDGFFDLGGDSLRAAKLVGDVARSLKVDLPAKILVDAADFDAFCGVVRHVMSGKSLLEREATPEQLRADADLAQHLVPTANRPRADMPRIILTGATGFVGAFLLMELLRDPRVSVTCLIRAFGNVEARERLRKSLLRYGLDAALLDRTQVLAADLTKPRLGLDAGTYQRLSEEHEQIFHCGALVNFTYSYNALREANVMGTLRVLELACAGRAKEVHYISAGSAAEASLELPHGKVREDDPLDAPERLTMGYSQSKWVAERMVQSLFARGLSGTIQRLGLVWGHSETGVSNLQDLALRAMLTSLELGVAPSWKYVLHFTTVDFTVRAIVALAAASPSGRVYHLTSGDGLSSQEQYELLRGLRPELALVSYDVWRRRMLDVISADAEHPLAPFRHFFQEAFHELPLVFDNSLATGVLNDAGISCPRLSTDLLRRYGAYFASQGLLTRALPAGSASSVADRPN